MLPACVSIKRTGQRHPKSCAHHRFTMLLSVVSRSTSPVSPAGHTERMLLATTGAEQLHRHKLSRLDTALQCHQQRLACLPLYMSIQRSPSLCGRQALGAMPQVSMHACMDRASQACMQLGSQ